MRQQTQPGWFSLLRLRIGKPPRPRYQRTLRDIFLNRSATPPCLGARRGINAPPQFIHTFPAGQPARLDSRIARSVSVNARMIVPTAKRRISERIAWRYEPVFSTTAPNKYGPIHDVPRSETSYSPKKEASYPVGIIRENNERDNACDPPSTMAITAPIPHA